MKKSLRRLIYLYINFQYLVDGCLYFLGIRKGHVPHVVKRWVVKSFAKQYGPRSFVETGTYLGDMLAAVRNHFDELYSVELSEELYQKAQQRFALDLRIKLYQGNSSQELGKILGRVGNKALFWLDAHYSGGNTARGCLDTPIMEELKQIFGHKNCGHIILIDDARLFIGKDGYPTIDQLRDYLVLQEGNYEITVGHDIIRLTPGRAN